MKNKGNALPIVILIIAIIVGAIYFSTRGSEPTVADDSMMKDDSMMMEKDDSMMKDNGTMMEKEDSSMMMEDDSMAMVKRSYEAYSPEKLSRAQNGDVILFFKAPWCPTCRALDKDIMANLGSIPENTSILTVDYDNSTALKQKYGVTYQHTFVQVDTEGNQIAKWSGSPTLTSLLLEVK